MTILDSECHAFGARISAEVLNYVEGMSSGAAEERSVIKFTKPSNELFIGCLFPKEAAESKESREITTATEEPDEETSDSQSSQSAILPTSTKPFSLSVSFLAKPEGLIRAVPSLKLYYRVIPTIDDYRESLKNEFGRPGEAFDVGRFLASCPSDVMTEHPEVWERVDIELETTEFDLSTPNSVTYLPGSFKGPTRPLYAAPIADKLNISSLKDGEKALDDIWGTVKATDVAGWKAILKVNDFGPVPGEPEEYHMFTVTLINNTDNPDYDKRNVFETAFFDCRLTIDMGQAHINPIKQKWNYELPYSSEVTGDAPPSPFEVKYPVYVWGNGCFPEFLEDENRIVTNILNTAETNRVTPVYSENTPGGSNLLFANLSDDPIYCMEQLQNYLEDHIPQYEGVTGGNKAKNDTQQFAVVIERFTTGVERLRSDPKAQRAFRLMNKVYRSAYGEGGSWRLFQLVFIVGNIEPVCSRTNGTLSGQDENAEILFVSTGGGKTEAYVGLSTFLIFYQRLVGQNFGIGTWVKFPLRLLALDQFDRLLKTIIWAESIRKDESIGGDPFSLGFFVGNTAQFPGTVAEWVLTRMEKPGDPAAGWKPTVFSRKKGDDEKKGALLSECPICRARNQNEGDYRWSYLPQEHRVKHWCEQCKTEFFVYITDEEVYRYLPSILISTVDKLAVGAWRPPMAALLGATVYRCEKHGFTVTPKECSIMSKRCGNASAEIFNVKDDAKFKYTGPFDNQGLFLHCKCSHPILKEEKTHNHAPVLEVQDELHLLHENLGTTDSYFETLVDWIINKNTGRFPKHICMSATLAGARRQVGLLYLRGVNLWPGDAPSAYPLDDPPCDAFFKHEQDSIHRIYVGIMPHGKTPDFASYRCLQHAWCRIQACIASPALIRSVTKAPATIGDDELKDFITDYYRKSFVYQGRKIGTHNFASSLDKIVNPDILRGSPSCPSIIYESVTGDNSMDEIRTVRSRMEKKGDLDCLISTSLISHGVDMTNVNLMFFQGIPDMTSEFIQASSRVGRKYPGIIFISFYPSRSRDVELSSSFKMYVDTMRYWVESVAISRWCEQALREIFVTATCFILTTHGQQILGGPQKIRGTWPITIHLLGDPSSRPGFLRWRTSLGPSLDNDIKQVLMDGLGFTGPSQKNVPPDLLPTPYIMDDLIKQLNRMYGEFTTTLTRKAARTPNKYKDGQIASFCKAVLGSPQDEDGNPNWEFEDRWFQCMTGLRGIQTPVMVRLTYNSAKYLGED